MKKAKENTLQESMRVIYLRTETVNNPDLVDSMSIYEGSVLQMKHLCPTHQTFYIEALPPNVKSVGGGACGN